MMKRRLLAICAMLSAITVLAEEWRTNIMTFKGERFYLICHGYIGPAETLTLSNMIGNQAPIGTQFSQWDVAGQKWRPRIVLDCNGHWGPKGTTVLERGTAYGLQIPAMGTNEVQISFSGIIPTSSTEVVLYGGGKYAACGYPYPTNIAFKTSGYATTLAPGDSVYFWDGEGDWIYSGKTPKGWSGSANTNILTDGEGFFVYKASAGNASFIEPLPY